MIDTNVYLERWPFRRLPDDEPRKLLDRLARHGVTEAWVGSFDALLHRDVAGVNARLAETCRRLDARRLRPFGTVNPVLPDWEDDLHRCVDRHGMAGIRLHPNYHGYRLDHPAFARLLAMAAFRDVVVQLVVTMEDERTQHLAFRVPHVDTAPLEALVRQLPRLRLVLLSAFRALRPEQVARLTSAGQVYVDLAMLEGAGGLARLLDVVSPQRVLFGSHFPLFYFESALFKVREAALPTTQLRAVCEGNARALLPAGA